MSLETDAQGTRLTLNLWHPNCWAIQATADNPGGILAHAVYDSPASGESGVNSLFTAYGESEAEVDDLLAAIGDSPLTDTVRELHTQVDTRRGRSTPGRVSREFFLEHDPSDMICPLLLEHGFVHSSPGRIEGGREYWNVRYAGERGDIEAALDAIREEGDADVQVERIGSVASERRAPENVDTLTPAQREAFELARERGYVLSQGENRYEGPGEELLHDEEVRQQFLGG